MKLSFVIPAYNEEKYIGKCLESVFRELKGKDFDAEVIVVNNASTDRTAAVAASFPGVRVVEQPIKGLVHARHAGFVASTGDIIANIDADTMLTLGWVDRVMAEFSKDLKLVALSGPFIYYDVPSHVRRGVKFFYRLGYLGYLLNRFVLRVGSMLQGGNFIVRRTALEQAGGFDRTITFYGEDTDIARRLHPLGKVRFTFGLPMYASGRRLMKEGLATMAARYALNHFWTMYGGRPYDNDYIDIRPTGDGALQYEPQNRRREFALVTAVVILFFMLGGAGVIIGASVYAQETPKQLAINVYHRIRDNDNDFSALKTKLTSVKQRVKNIHMTSPKSKTAQ